MNPIKLLDADDLQVLATELGSASQPAGLLHELFERQARLRPHATALVEGERSLSYAQLDHAAERLARRLARLGVSTGDRVALLLPRSMNRHIGLLAVLKAGAAYVPLDPEYPDDRIRFILADCGAAAVITVSALAGALAGLELPRITLDAAGAAAEADGAGPGSDHSFAAGDLPLGGGVSPTDLCYIIYTSGTTGRPKGVAIEHRSACHFVAAERAVFRVEPADRVYQGFSIAFDASVEEIWLALAAGATLVVGTDEMVRAGSGLAALLTRAGVTIFSCVPTLLAMIEGDLPTVRLLIVGGEACPAAIVARWLRPGRRMVNTYGPTEATVVATYSDLEVDQPVTIGKPLPGYYVALLDERLQPTPAGEDGELFIGGPGLARGYLNRPELTREKFIATPQALLDSAPERLYRTGDIGRLTPAGDIEFLGRLDGQIKLRGFRVELSEIEAVLLEAPDVLAAAVTVHELSPGVEQLVAYIVPRRASGSSENGVAACDEHALREALADRLPRYMIPAVFETVGGLPTLPSGKVDRRQLPAPRSRLARNLDQTSPARTPLEQRLWDAWRTVFAPARVELDDDFFLDLGGHSLLAARMVSRLRGEPGCQALSMLDVYNHPTIEQLAAQLARASEASALQAAVDPGDAAGRPEFHAIPRRRHFCCGLAQAAGLYFTLGAASLQWLAPYLCYALMVEDQFSKLAAVGGACAALLAAYPAMLVVVVAAKWMLIGRCRPGSYPLWGYYYFRWWLAQALRHVVPTSFLAGTPLLNLYYRAMGARIGRNVYLGADSCDAFDLLTIGDDACVGIDASLAGYTVSGGQLHIAPVTIGRRAFVGTRSIVSPGASIGDGGQLEDLSLLPRGATIPPGERWKGSPAAPVAAQDDARPEITTAGPDYAEPDSVCLPASTLRRFCFGLASAVGVFMAPLLGLGACLPGVMYLNHMDYHAGLWEYLVAAPLVAMSFVVFLCLEIAVVKWLALGRVRPGVYPLYHSFHFRKWFVDQLLELSLDVMGPLYATIYLAPWYRLLGARLGPRAEISTASFISPDLLSIEEEGFIADAVSLGAARVQDNRLMVAQTHIGRRTFIGNSALVPPGASIGDGALIGCLSTPPGSPPRVAGGSSWLGSPGLFLPSRQTSAAFDDASTFKPSRRLWLQRAFIEFFRVTLPASVFLLITSALLNAVLWLRPQVSLATLVLLFPLLYVMCGLVATLFVIVAKWALMGEYKPSEQPLWSSFVWRTELLTALHENLADLLLTGNLKGTPFLPWFFRLLGAKIGRRAWMETTALTEFDLITLGDDVALNNDATVQTHLFEDRVMKMSTIAIGDRASVGALSLVLYDTAMGPGARLGELSLLMKGETLPAESDWEGSPARALGRG